MALKYCTFNDMTKNTVNHFDHRGTEGKRCEEQLGSLFPFYKRQRQETAKSSAGFYAIRHNRPNMLGELVDRAESASSMLCPKNIRRRVLFRHLVTSFSTWKGASEGRMPMVGMVRARPSQGSAREIRRRHRGIFHVGSRGHNRRGEVEGAGARSAGGRAEGIRAGRSYREGRTGRGQGELVVVGLKRHEMRRRRWELRPA